jgi:hypothetical protein
MRFKKILRSPISTNHSLNARSPLGNDERSFAVRGRSSGWCKVGVPRRLNQNAPDLEMHLAGHEGLSYWTVKATVPTFALTEPDVPVTVIV